jgi:hypothetical protein
MPSLAETCGFSYYYVNPSRSILRCSGAIRFYITASEDPSMFASGTDLLSLNIAMTVASHCRKASALFCHEAAVQEYRLFRLDH